MRYATAYLSQRATSSRHLQAVLHRKARRWHEREGAELDEDSLRSMIDACLQKLTASGFLDDVVFAAARSRRLLHQGLPAWRVARDLASHGVDAVAPLVNDEDPASQARRYAARKRLGPYRIGARAPYRDKDLRSLVRAGFGPRVAATVIDAECIEDESLQRGSSDD